MLLVALIRVNHMDGDVASDVVVWGYGFVAISLAAVGVVQKGSGQAKEARSSFVFATAAIVCILAFEVFHWLPLAA